ncbi:kinase-like domain-containing protein [Pavlovales sp. CCMP2436]|nr:kinase-like domain-containing protein [Pavlovales sp. CCMP2436]
MAALADEARRKLEKPRLGEAEAARLALDLWGIACAEGTATPLDSYDDANFKLRSTDGPSYVLKVHNGVESARPAFIEAQNEAMEAVRANACLCPVALPSLAGRAVEFAKLASSGERTHAIRLLPFVSARLMAEVLEPTPDVLREIGVMLGRVTNALASFEHPATVRSHAWDLALFSQSVSPLLHAVEDVESRGLVRQVLKRFAESVAPSASLLREQVIHGDLNDQNILVSEDLKGAPVGVLDFGDMVRSWRVSDPSIACAYLVIQLHYKGVRERTAGEISALCRAFLSGFAQACELSEDERAMLSTLVLVRICTSLVFGAYSASLDPANEYLSLMQLPGWKALRLLLDVPRTDLLGFLTRAE